MLYVIIFFHQTNKQSRKVMVSACVSWNGATKPFSVKDKKLKVNSKSYKKNSSRKELLFSKDHSNVGQDFLMEKLHTRSFKHTDGPQVPWMAIRLITNFGIKWTSKFMEIGLIRPLQTKKNWRKSKRRIWPEASSDLKDFRIGLKEFIPRLTVVQGKHKNVVWLVSKDSFVCF